MPVAPASDSGTEPTSRRERRTPSSHHITGTYHFFAALLYPKFVKTYGLIKNEYFYNKNNFLKKLKKIYYYIIVMYIIGGHADSDSEIFARKTTFERNYFNPT